MLIAFGGFAQKIQNLKQIRYTKSYDLTYINTFGIDQSFNETYDYESIDQQDINYINYVVYVDSNIATSTMISPANPLYLDVGFFL